MNKITKPSKRFSLLFKALFYLYPVTMLLLWLFSKMSITGEFSLDVNTDGNAITTEMLDPEWWQRLAGFALAMLPGAALMYIYHCLAKLFSLYANGAIFEKANVDNFRKVAWGIIAHQLLAIPSGTLITLVLTLTNPQGERLVQVGVDDTNISMVVVGIMILFISRIMDEGRKMNDEQALTV